MYRKIAFILFRVILITGTAFMSAPRGTASPVDWSLAGLTFDDGGTLSGSFVYDVDTNSYSAIDIITTPGSVLPGATYTALDPYDSSSGLLGTLTEADGDLTGTPWLLIDFSNALTDPGGDPYPYTFVAYEGYCTTDDCTNSIGTGFTVDRGTAVAGNATQESTSPEPSSCGLALMGVGFLMALMRKMRQRIIPFGSNRS